MLINGDSLYELKKLDDNSVDLMVTDPPYGYSFMGKEWDKALPDKGIWKECLRVLKHGGFAYVMSAPRQDVLSRMMVDLEDVGFNTAFTSMYWAYATGFPKAMNMGKAIDKKLGKEREVIGQREDILQKQSKDFERGYRKIKDSYDAGSPERNNGFKTISADITKPASEQAKKLDGSYAGFQPKPAVEVIIVCMKPLDCKGYVEQALSNQKGVSWFDDCRIPFTNDNDLKSATYGGYEGEHIDHTDGKFGMKGSKNIEANSQGRYPANLLVSDNAVDIGKNTKKTGRPNCLGKEYNGVATGSQDYGDFNKQNLKLNYTDEGDFSRYFDLDKWCEAQFIITPKASKSEKNKGLDDFEEKKSGSYNGNRKDGKPSMKTGSGNERNLLRKNHHPTVKPLKLMSYLITLGSREGDVILDPFMGSGTTPLAAKQLNRKYIGIEREEEYYKICCARVGDEPTVLEEKVVEVKKVVKEVIKEVNNLCKICGYKAKDKASFETHLTKPFHQGYV